MSRLAAWTEQTNDITKLLLSLGQRPDVISLAGGLPSPDLFPSDAIADAFSAIIRESSNSALQYGPAEGLVSLREWVADRLRREGLAVRAENVIITTGSQQALAMVGQALLSPGDGVAVDGPVYLAALDAWRPYGPKYTLMRWSNSGDHVDLRDVDHAPPKFAYCLPTFRNPTGESLSLSARHALLEAAQREDVLILEDDPYKALRFEGEELPSMLSLDAGNSADPYDGSVMACGSVSKILAPALRIGWLVAPERMVEALAHAKQGLDLCASPLSQLVALRLLRSGIEEAVLERARPLYRERRNALLAALDHHLSGVAHWTRPSGGMFVWVTLNEGLRARDLFDRAAAAGVGILPGDVFHACSPSANTFRLSFSTTPAERMDEAIGRLASALTGMLPGS